MNFLNNSNCHRWQVTIDISQIEKRQNRNNLNTSSKRTLEVPGQGKQTEWPFVNSSLPGLLFVSVVNMWFISMSVTVAQKQLLRKFHMTFSMMMQFAKQQKNWFWIWLNAFYWSIIKKVSYDNSSIKNRDIHLTSCSCNGRTLRQ